MSPHSRQVLHDGNAELCEFVPISNARLHQEFRGLDGAKRNDDFQRSFEPTQRAIVKNLHAGRAIPIENDPRDERSRQHGEVRLSNPRICVGAEHRLPTPVLDDLIHDRATAVGLHHAAVRVLKPLETRLLRPLQAQR